MTSQRAPLRSCLAIIITGVAACIIGTALTPAPAWGQTLSQGSFFRSAPARPELDSHQAFVGDEITYRVHWHHPDDEEPDTARVSLYRQTPYTSANRVAIIELDDDGEDPSDGQWWEAEGDGGDTPWGAHIVRFEFLFDDAADRFLVLDSPRLDVNSPPNQFSFWMDPTPYAREFSPADTPPWETPLPPAQCVATDNSTVFLWVEIGDPDQDAIGDVEVRLRRNHSAESWQPMYRDPDQDPREHPARFWAAIDTSDLDPSDFHPLTGARRWRIYQWEVRAWDDPDVTHLPDIPAAARPTGRRSDWRHDDAHDRAPSNLNFWISAEEWEVFSVNQSNVAYPHPVITPSTPGSHGSGSASSTFDFRFRYRHPDGLRPRGIEAYRTRDDDPWLPLWYEDWRPMDPGDPHALRDRDHPARGNPVTHAWVQPMIVEIDGQEHFAAIDTGISGQNSTDPGAYAWEQWEDGIVFRYRVEPRHGNVNAFHPDGEPPSQQEYIGKVLTQLSTFFPGPILSTTDWQSGEVFRNMFTGFADPLSLRAHAAIPFVGTIPSAPLTLRHGQLQYRGIATADFRPPGGAGGRRDVPSEETYDFEVDGALSQGGYSGTMLDGDTPSWEMPDTDIARHLIVRQPMPIEIRRDYWAYPNMNHSRHRSTDTLEFWVRAHEYMNTAPDYVRLHIGNESHLMKEARLPGDSYRDGGVWFRHTLSNPGPGSHTFRFESNNTQHTTNFPDRHGGTLRTLPVNRRPTLSDGSVTPATGEEGTAYVYEVTYRDEDGDPPHLAICNIFDPAENSGGRIIDATSGGDTIIDEQAEWEPGALVNRFVVITSSDITDRRSAKGWYFRVLENTETELTVRIPDQLGYHFTTGQQAFNAISSGDRYRIVRRARMTPHQPSSPTEQDFRDGVVYRYTQDQLSNVLDEPKEYRFWFTFQDHWRTPTDSDDPWYHHDEPGEFTSWPDVSDWGVSAAMRGGPTVEARNQPPILSDPSVDPIEATSNDMFRFEVTFTDANNDMPSLIQLRTSSTADRDAPDFGTFGSPVPMEEVDPDDRLTSDGKRYFAEIDLEIGDSYAFTVRASDGKATWEETVYDTETGETPFEEHGDRYGVFGPTVIPNTPPMIDDVWFAIWDPETGEVNKENTQADFFRECRHQPDEEVPRSPFGVLDEVTWYLEYRDLDNHAPAEVFPKIIFDDFGHGIEFSMEPVWPADDDYAATKSNYPRDNPDEHLDGVRYRFSSTELPSNVWRIGTVRFRFLGNDGDSQVRLPKTGWFDIQIENTRPVLSNPQVIPAFGTEEDTYVYQVTYTDEDNDPPEYLRLRTSVSADPDAPNFGTFVEPREWTPEDPGGWDVSGDDYIDGVEFSLELPAPPVGARNAFTFEASDGIHEAQYEEPEDEEEAGFVEIDGDYGAFGPVVASLARARFTDEHGDDLEPDEEWGRRVVEEGDTVYFEIVDLDRSAARLGPGEIEVQISDTSVVDGDVQTLTLSETGSDTGVFTGQMDTYGGAEPRDGVLNVAAGPDGAEIQLYYEGIEVELGETAATDTLLVIDTIAPAAIAPHELTATSGVAGVSMHFDWTDYQEYYEPERRVDVEGYWVWMFDRNFDVTDLYDIELDEWIDEPHHTVDAGVQELTIEDLTAGETYYFAVVPFDEVPNWDYDFNTIAAEAEDRAGPWVENRDPEDGDTEVPLDTSIYFEVLDEGTGVRRDSIELRVFVIEEENGERVETEITAQGELAIEPGDAIASLFEVTWTHPDDFPWNSEVRVELEAEDDAGYGLRDPADGEWSFAVLTDHEAPQVTDRLFNAEAGTMSFRLTDNRSGIASDSIELWLRIVATDDESVIVDWENVIEDATIRDRNPLDVEVRYERPDGWGYNARVDFRIEAADQAGNEMDSDEWSRETQLDDDPPIIDRFSPADGATAVPLDTPISFRVRDDLSGVVVGSIRLWVNGDEIDQDHLDFGDAARDDVRAAVTVTYDPDEEWLEDWEHTYEVRVEANDEQGNPARVEAGEWTFTTREEPTYDIRGRITDADGSPLAGVRVEVDGRAVTTDGNGLYRVRNLTAGTYTVRPIDDDYDFSYTASPEEDEAIVTLDDASETGVDFTGVLRKHSISGRITHDGEGVPQVTVTDGTRTALTDDEGYYEIEDVPNGTYTITPSRDLDDDGYEDFTYPDAPRTVVVDGADETDVNFKATKKTYSISGTIRDSRGEPVVGVTLSDGIRKATTDDSGNYTLAGVPAGTVTVTPARTGRAFDPAETEVTVPPDATGIDFTAYRRVSRDFGAGMRMVAVPAHLPEGRDRAVDVFETDHVARWNPAATPPAWITGTRRPDATQLRVRPGAGFFVQFPSATTVDVPGDPVDPSERFSVRVETGWNQVGNAFDASLPLSGISPSGGTTLPPYGFIWDTDAGSYRLVSRTPAFNAARTYMEAWEGAWFRISGAAGTLNLEPPTGVASESMLEGRAARLDAPDDGWLLPIIARVGDRADLTTLAGVGSGDASAGYQVANPPKAPQTVDVYFTGGDKPLAHDVRPGGAGDMVWTFAVETDIANSEVEVRLPDLSDVPHELAVYLTDEAADRRMYARTMPAYTFTSGDDGALRNFKLEVAPRGADNLTIRSASVQSTGNSVVLTYDVSADCHVNVEVVNIAGRTVRRLVQARPTQAGRDELTWDLRSAEGTLVPGGNYLIRIEAIAENGQRVHALRPAQVTR